MVMTHVTGSVDCIRLVELIVYFGIIQVVC